MEHIALTTSEVEGIRTENQRLREQLYYLQRSEHHSPDLEHLQNENLRLQAELDQYRVIAVDIEDRKQAEEALRDRGQRLQLVLKVARLGTWETDLTTGECRIAPETERIFGMKSGTYHTSHDWELSIHPEDYQATQQAYQAALEGGPNLDIEFRIIWPDGSIHWARTWAIVIRDGAGKPQRMYGVTNDITARKEADEDIRRRTERLKILSDCLAQLLSERNPAQIISTVFPKVSAHIGAELFFSYLVDEARGTLHLNAHAGISDDIVKRIDTLKFGEAYCGLAAETRTTIVADEARIATDPVAALAREAHVKLCISIPIIVGSRLLATACFASRNKSHLKDRELEFLQLICGYVAIAIDRARTERDVFEAKRKGEKANHAKDDFIAALSHELRTPLTPILMTASSLEADQSLNSEMHEQIGIIRRNVELETRLIDDLLDVTKIASGKFPLRLQKVDVHQLILRAMETVRPDARKKRLRTQLDLEALDLAIRGDSTRLQQVFWNLLKNAIKFTPTEGGVTIRTFNPDPHSISVEVRDTGIGIPLDLLAKIFNRFEQGITSGDHRFGGLGLGLAISKAIIELHGGTISVSSEGPHQGASFTVNLPTCRLGEISPSRPLSQPEKSSPTQKILLVEDNEPTRSVLARLLTRDGHQVAAAATFADALQAAYAQPKTMPFGVLISDLGLPDGSGLNLVRALKAENPHLTAIALSGYGTEEDIRKSLQAGFKVHLTKPIGIEELRRSLAA